MPFQTIIIFKEGTTLKKEYEQPLELCLFKTIYRKGVTVKGWLRSRYGCTSLNEFIIKKAYLIYMNKVRH